MAPKVTAALIGKVAAQLEVHPEMPTGLEETLPGPVTLTLIRAPAMVLRNVAVTLRALAMFSEQVGLVPDAAQSPVQRSNTHPKPGMACSVTRLPFSKGASHRLEQALMPPGAE